MRPRHWQLRHYISSPELSHLYYASGQDVYCLDTATKKRKHIATLPFESRCTASGYGWVCVGGERDGHFAAIKLDGSGHRTLDVDSALPIDGWRQNVGQRPATVNVERIGEEIVNSISIHRIQDEDAHLDDIVAVLTNNDKTVRIYSLPSGQETRVKPLPFAINHATISPDGQTLVAVGDYNQAYFFTREIIDTPPQIPKPHNRLTSASVEWKLSNVVTLHVSNPESTIGYFTTAWSPTGHLVAVGSEGGYITVMDTELLANPELDDDDSIVAVAPGSRADRPSPHPGAIRTMIFSPEPWDLLIWAEDQGRICIGDLRSGLKSRQVVNLEPKDESLDRFVFEDVIPAEQSAIHLDDLDAAILRRYGSGNDSGMAVNFATEYIEVPRRQREQRQEMPSARTQTSTPGSRQPLEGDEPYRLTTRQQQMLDSTVRQQQMVDSARAERQRDQARSNGHIPRSVDYTAPDLSGGRSPSDPRAANAPQSISEMLRSVEESFTELARAQAASTQPSSPHATNSASTLPPLYALREGSPWLSAHRAALQRTADSSRLPRRRPFTTPNADEALANREMTGERQSLLPEVAEAEEDNPWRADGEAVPAAARTHGDLPPPAPDGNLDDEDLELAAMVHMAHWERTRAMGRELARDARATRTVVEGGARSVTMAEPRRLSSLPDDYEALLRRTQMRHVGVRTAGLAMSPDGRILWAACEDGIFEIEIKVKGRMFWPAIEPR